MFCSACDIVKHRQCLTMSRALELLISDLWGSCSGFFARQSHLRVFSGTALVFLIVGSQILQQWLAVSSWMWMQTQITGYGEWGAWAVCALDWFFFVCCTCRDGCRAGDQSISSLLEVAGAIMGNGQEKKKTFNTRVVLLLCCLQITGALWKLPAPLIGADVC